MVGAEKRGQVPVVSVWLFKWQFWWVLGSRRVPPPTEHLPEVPPEPPEQRLREQAVERAGIS